MNALPFPPSTSPKPKFIGARGWFVRGLAVCVLALLFTGGAEARPVRWEYLVLNAGTQNRPLQTLLNGQGTEGWELVQINAKGVAIFKRPKAK